MIEAALASGINLFDTADIYGVAGASEEIVGTVLRPHRAEVVIATKFGMDMGTGELARGSRRYLTRALEASLRRLGTDYIDLYQLHEPDPLTPIEETISALDDAVRSGKVRYVGSSNLAAWQVVEADLIARELGASRFISAQNLYSLLEREVERELVAACRSYGVGILPFYPLASGLLTGKFKRGEAAPPGTRIASRPERLASADFNRIERLEGYARSAGMELIDLAFAYLLAEGQVGSVIAGATSPEQIARNVATQEHSLSLEQAAEVRGLG